MSRSAALLLQVVLVLIGMAALAFLLGEPHLEGRNAQATTFQVYFQDPFLAYVYLGSTPFFVALYLGFRLCRHVRQQRPLSQATVDALRSIKYCAIILLGFVAGGVVFILRFGDPDDRPAGIFMSFLAASGASVIAFAAATGARHLQHALRRAERSRG
jgi:hypothetical protein